MSMHNWLTPWIWSPWIGKAKYTAMRQQTLFPSGSFHSSWGVEVTEHNKKISKIVNEYRLARVVRPLWAGGIEGEHRKRLPEEAQCCVECLFHTQEESGQSD
jgi:hypothetical protein